MITFDFSDFYFVLGDLTCFKTSLFTLPLGVTAFDSDGFYSYDPFLGVFLSGTLFFYSIFLGASFTEYTICYF